MNKKQKIEFEEIIRNVGAILTCTMEIMDIENEITGTFETRDHTFGLLFTKKMKS